MTFQEFARSIRDSDEYRDVVKRRAFAGELAPDLELFLLEMADGRTPVSADTSPRARQGPTLALIRPSAPSEEA